MLQIDIVTLFPGIAQGPLEESILKRAQDKECVKIRVRNLRDYAEGKHKITDDRPYGGGPGMLLKPEPVFKAVEDLRRRHSRVVLMAPSGKRFDQKMAQRLAGEQHLIFLCGHYEGFDHRVHEMLADEEISIGDYVLTNGALAAMVVVDAVVRLLPGVVGDAESVLQESFTTGMLDHPQYTRPPEFRGRKVPEILLGGNHAAIAQWRARRAKEQTWKSRRDLLKQRGRKKSGARRVRGATS